MTATIFLAVALIAQPNTKPSPKADAPDSALTIEIVSGIDPMVDILQRSATYRVKNTSQVVLHHLVVAHVYRDQSGKRIGIERGSAVNAHIKPGQTSTVKIFYNPDNQWDKYVIEATANRKKVKISEKD